LIIVLAVIVISYDLYQNISEPDELLLYEEWKNIDVFNDYKNSAAFAEIMAKVFPLLKRKSDSAYFESDIIGP
jgi:quinol monooxygenase YgiN